MEVWFFFTAFLVIVSALGVVCFKNAIYSGLCLIVNLLGVAAIFASLDAHFLAVAQVIVYAGAIMVLVMFVLMLLNAKAETPRWTTYLYLAGGGAFAVIFFWQFAELLVSGREVFKAKAAAPVVGSVAAIGRILYKDYIFLFEIASVLILAAIAGAYWLARHHRTSGRSIGNVTGEKR